MQLLLFPQIVFASAAAFAVFYYVATNIEEIKAKQKVEIGMQSDADMLHWTTPTWCTEEISTA